ncbi:hypothetical protein BGW38_004223, partial [Lunasporangiospora selenospora]
MSLPPLTFIPITQPTCGEISLSNPTPRCMPLTPPRPPTNNANNTAGSSPPQEEPLEQGCFVQPTGLFCAPLATTRGFLYSLNETVAHPGPGATSTAEATSAQPRPVLIPRLSVPLAYLSTPINNQSLGIDGRPIRYEEPARLGQTCYGIPLPPRTDPLWGTLVLIANQRLNESVGDPGLGAGEDVFGLRGDCEVGSFCEINSTLSVPFPTSTGTNSTPTTTTPTTMTVGVGICKEQYPVYHSCSSYFECLSMRCNDMASEPKSKQERQKRALLDLFSIRAGQDEEKEPEAEDHPLFQRESKRRIGTVCLPARAPSETGTGNENGGKISTGSSFPGWMGAVLAIVLVMAVTLVIVLVRRRVRRKRAQGRMLNDKSQPTLPHATLRPHHHHQRSEPTKSSVSDRMRGRALDEKEDFSYQEAQMERLSPQGTSPPSSLASRIPSHSDSTRLGGMFEEGELPPHLFRVSSTRTVRDEE